MTAAPKTLLFPQQENYAPVKDSGFSDTIQTPLSTFAVDVDTASYANVRRLLNEGSFPPADAVRIEELINYFSYNYPAPEKAPVNMVSEVAPCPWNDKHLLLQIGVKSKPLDLARAPASNLVFLLDVSGSMYSPEKLPLLVSAFKLLVNQLRPEDSVAIVVYAGASGVVLEPTNGNQKERILAALDQLTAGGSTAGSEGIELAYRMAEKMFSAGANNRVILATDGDFNVGMTSEGELVRLIESNRNKGIFLNVLGFGSGYLNDSVMEKLADHGNGQYAYIDNLLEARKTLVQQLAGTLFTVAKDVKLQVEFNPALVSSYRLIGYENRRLQDADFFDDKKDAGDMGAGHTVTALYELVPAEIVKKNTGSDFKYRKVVLSDEALAGQSLAQVKYRYKNPDSDQSELLIHEVKVDSNGKPMSTDLGFASAVAEWGLLLTDSNYKSSANFDALLQRAQANLGTDPEGRRHEFVQLVKLSDLLYFMPSSSFNPDNCSARIYFSRDSSELTEQAQISLKQVAACFMSNRELEGRLVGHSDEHASDLESLELGNSMVYSVKTFLEAEGLQPARLSTISYGHEMPFAGGDSESARAANRVVEVQPYMP